MFVYSIETMTAFFRSVGVRARGGGGTNGYRTIDCVVVRHSCQRYIV